jgi:pyruvate formate lyase activating enzyme
MAKISRRDFLIFAGGATACGIGAAAHLAGRRWWEWVPTEGGVIPPEGPQSPWSVEASYYASFAADGSLNCGSCHDTPEGNLPVSYCHIPHTGDYVRCNLCPHHCIIADGERGTCRVRENRGGKLYSIVYGNPCSVHIDPIEKKPLYHFLPTIPAFSLATAGCNLRCLYCQNWSISQVPPEDTQNYDFPPEVLVQLAVGGNAPVIAYTYSEPIIFYEYMVETARIAREAGLRNVVISAGFINREPLVELCGLVDAIKIDLKGYDEDFYREVCGGELAPVLQTLETIYESGTHLEIVNLVVPTLNDSMEQLRALSRWVARDLSPDIPLHFSRFHPDYKLANLPATPTETLDEARQIAMEEGIRFAYVGNLPGHPGNNTYCPNCGGALVVRQGFSVLEYHLLDGVCEYCGTSIPGVWWPELPEGEPVQVPAGPPDQ